MATHFLGPVLNRERTDHPRGVFSNLPSGWGPEAVESFNDFIQQLDYSTSNYTLTLVGTGTAAVNTATNSENGGLLLTTTTASGDSNSLQSKQETWKLVPSSGITAGKRLWMEVGIQVSNVSTTDLMVALSTTDTTPLDSTDYVGFLMSTGAAAIKLKSVISSTVTTVDPSVSMVAATQTKLGIYWDGALLRYYINRGLVGQIAAANAPTVTLAPVIHLKTNTTAAATALIDYIYVAKER